MVGRLFVFSVVSVLLLGVLVLFPSGDRVGAVTYDVAFGADLTCAGPDGIYDPLECDTDGDGACSTAEVTARCLDSNDDDGDGKINDGCPAYGTPEAPDWCLNNVDDDPTDDGEPGHLWVNDGCPVIQDYAENDPSNPCDLPDAVPGVCGTAAACDSWNNTDDDGDTVANDGCPQKGSDPEWHDCVSDTDDDGDGYPNDGCSHYDDSCVEDATYGANGAGLHADMRTLAIIPDVTPKHSQFQQQYVFSVPAGWGLVKDSHIPNGAYVARLHAEVNLALMNGECNTLMVLNFDLFDCSTDNSPENLISWEGSGENVATGPADGPGELPYGCTKYPEYLNDLLGGLRPRLRLYGFITVYPGQPAVQINFLVMNPGQLSVNPLPEADMGDSLGYPAFFVLNNPLAPLTEGTVSEFCTPMETYLEAYGVTAGEGYLYRNAGWTGPSVPNYDEDVMLTDPAERCGDGEDNDGDTKVDEMCGMPRHTNPAAGSGVYDTGTHLVSIYNESYRDADDDGTANNQDECPFDWDDWGAPDTDGDKIADACDDTSPCSDLPGTCPNGSTDQDCDDLDNQTDTCPCVTARECETGSPAADVDGDCTDAGEAERCVGGNPHDTDDDGDGYINDGCPIVETWAECDWRHVGECEWMYMRVCADDVDDDGDGAINDGCPVIGHPDDDGDMIGNECDTLGAGGIGQGPDTADGDFVSDMERWAMCIGELDTDVDGWCDSTEQLLIEDPEAEDWASIRPEHYGVDYTITAADIPPGDSPGTCSDFQWYSTSPDGNGDPIDNDGDTVINMNEADCICPTGTDGDCDGVADGSDNCPNAPNPEQLDTDSDGYGDACDPDDDADKINDDLEWAAGTDPKEVCSPRNFDPTNDGVIDILDVLTFKDPLKVPNRPCNPGVDYSICEAIR